MTTALLLAGKDPQARRETARYLSQAGYRVDEAGDGVTVIKQFHRHAYQLILLDYELPVLNGLVTCRQIKKLSEVVEM